MSLLLLSITLDLALIDALLAYHLYRSKRSKYQGPRREV